MEHEKQFLLNFAQHLFAKTNSANNYAFVRHINGDIIIATQGLCDIVGIQSQNEVVNLQSLDFFERFSNYTRHDLEITNEKLQQGSGIVDVLIKLKNSDKLMLFSLIPINYVDGRCIGCYAVGRNANFPSYKELILIHTKNTTQIDTKELPEIELTDRDKVILFLLIAGFTQEEIADYMKCSRGFVGKYIAQSLCPKFGLIGSSTKLLVQRAIFNGVLNEIPEEITNELNAICC